MSFDKNLKLKIDTLDVRNSFVSFSINRADGSLEILRRVSEKESYELIFIIQH